MQINHIEAPMLIFAPTSHLMPGENRMLLIGIDEYEHIRPLSNAVGDVERFRRIMEERYGFSVVDKPLYNKDATYDNIVEALNALTYSLIPEDNLIIYYGGHGLRVPASKKGYWQPYNWKTIAQSLWNSAVIDLIEGIPAKHIWLISDSCFSGNLITQTREAGTKMEYEELEALPSRWVLTSGSEEPVSDGEPGQGSPFNHILCEFLQNNQNPSISLGDLFDAVIYRIRAATDQTPLASHIKILSHQGGQMILRLKSDSSGTIAPVTKPQFQLPELPLDNYISRTVTHYEFQKPEIVYFYDVEKDKTFLQDAILAQRRIVLLGSAGSGKSFELLNLGRILQNPDTPYVPIFKRLNTYTGQNIEAFLPESWETVSPASAVILLDGLDEIQTDFKFTAISKITEFCNKRPTIRIVISCRTNFYELPNANFSGTLEGFSVFMLNDISLKEISEYADKTLHVNGKEFIREVYDSSLLDVIQKPYFLDLLTNFYMKHGSFQVNRTVIYEEALTNYYVKDKEHFKTTGEQPGKAETFAMLEKLAFVMEMMGKNFITDDELEKVFPNKADLDKCKYLPAFKKQEKTNQWMFEHNNIQEFLAARVLAQKPFDKLIDIISFGAAGKQRVRPTWANTVSFYISIGNKADSDKVLEWIAENDVELLIRFEPDRINEQKRLSVFKQVFESYSKTQIWLTSNKFTDADLAKFAWMEGAIEYLLETINSPESTRITKLNAIRVLDNYNLSYFPKFVPIIKESLLDLLETEDFDTHDMYATIGALANLQITDKDTLDFVIGKFRKRKNQYIRAGIYKLIHHSAHLEEYLDYLFEGLDFSKVEGALDDRDSVNLMDESHHLKTALSQVKKAEGLKQLLQYFASEGSRSFYFSDYKEIAEAVIENSIVVYKTDPSIYDYVRDYFIRLEHQYNKESAKIILPFFVHTGTKWNLFRDIWTNKKLERYARVDLIETLITKDTITQFAEAYRQKEFTKEDAEELHQILFWKDRNHPEFSIYLDQLEKAVRGISGETLERPVFRDYNDVYKKKIQDAFNVLFDKPQFLKEVEDIFAEIGKEELTIHDLFGYQSAHRGDLEEAFNESAVDLVRNFTYHGRTVTLEEIRVFFEDKTAFYNYQIDAIYEDLHGNSNHLIEVSPDQINFIKDWCLQTGDVPKILWFFIHRFSIALEESKLLDLTYYYDFSKERKFEEPGTIEQLENFVSRQTLKKKVAANLLTEITDDSAWLSNAGYALRHNVKEVYPAILERLERADGNEYKYNEVLEYWFKKTGDAKRMTRFIEAVRSDILRWHGISLLFNSGKERAFLIAYLKRIMNSEGEARDSRFGAANYLMAMDDLEGIAFCTEQILANPDPRLEFRHDLHKMSMMKNPGAIPWLKQLLFLGKQPEYQNDRFNSLESVVIDTLYNIGIVSDENFIAVKEALLQFMKDHKDKLQHLNFLHFTINRMEEQLSMKKSQDCSIDQALVEWKKAL